MDQEFVKKCGKVFVRRWVPGVAEPRLNVTTIVTQVTGDALRQL